MQWACIIANENEELCSIQTVTRTEIIVGLIVSSYLERRLGNILCIGVLSSTDSVTNVRAG